MGGGRVPERTCIGCRHRSAKAQLLRFVAGARGADGGATGGSEIRLDPRCVELGRGAYVHRDAACVERALDRRVLARALRTGLTVQEVGRLRKRVERELDTT